MIGVPSIVGLIWPTPGEILTLSGGLQFKDAAPMLAGVVDNGVCADDPRVLVRLNEATRTILDYMIPVGGMMIANVPAQNGILILPPQMENAMEAHPVDTATAAYGNADTTQVWYEIVSQSAYLDPSQAMDNPLVDLGLNGNPDDPSDVRRIYFYPGLEPGDAVIQVTGAKRFLPVTNNEDYLIVQNIEALKCIILSIERYENNAVEDSQKFRAAALEILQAQVKKHMFDPRNYMVRKAAYLQDLVTYPQNSLGWVRAQIALDMIEALRAGKRDLTWAIQQAERRLMERAKSKDTIVMLTAEVVGGTLYFPASVEAVLAIDLDGCPIPIRSQFFQYLDNGPGAFPCHPMLVDQGNIKAPGFAAPRRKYKLIANCTEGSCISAVCKLRWVLKQPEDMMVIKNYEAIRLMMVGKFMEEAEKWQEAMANQQSAFKILDDELKEYLSGIRFTVHVQTTGFGMGDVGGLPY